MGKVEEIETKRLRLNPAGSKSVTILFCAVVLFLPAMAAAAEVSGKVINKTIERPAAGDEVLLMDVSADMRVSGRTRSDSSGNFRFRVAREGIPWLITVTHAGVRYAAAVPAGDRSTEVGVFDKTDSTAAVKSSIQVLQIESDAGHLRATEMFTVMNSSSPPRTVQKEDLFLIPLPAGAALLSSLAEGPGQSVVKSIAVVPPKENRCYFSFPLRPGTTKIQLQFQFPYSGSFTFTPYLPFPADMFGVVTPASMQFQSPELGAYTRLPDGNGGFVEFIRSANEGNGPSFTILGSGAARTEGSSNLAMLQARANSQHEPLAMAAGTETATAEKSLQSDHVLWLTLLVAMVIACLTAFVYLRRAKRRAVTGSETSSMTNELIREQLFSLELDRLQNRISKSKYATARSLLEKKLAATLSKTPRQ